MIIAQVCLRLATIKGHSKMCSFYCIWGSGGSENQSVSGVTTICHLLRIEFDQVVDCGLWNVGPLLFNGCAKFAGYWQELETRCHIRQSRASQTCSMGDMSGEYAGHARTGMISASRNCVQNPCNMGQCIIMLAT